MIKKIIQGTTNFFRTSFTDQRSWKFLLVFSVIIVSWQGLNIADNIHLSSGYRRGDATGFNYLDGKRFFYFYYYKHLFPMTNTTGKFDFSKEGADKLINDPSDTLLMEWNHWARLGDRGRIWLFYPHAWLNGTAENPSIKDFNIIFLVITLLALFFGFWKINRGWLGLILVFLIGSSPFLLYETYNNENIFGFVTCTGLFMLAVHLPVINAPFKYFYLILALASGIVIGLVFNVRNEPLLLLASCIFIYFTNKNFRWLGSVALGVLLLLGFYSTHKLVNHFFDKKFDETYAFVESHHGIPFTGGRIINHPFWHPFACGLGDFKNKYGFVLHDTMMFDYVIPILRQQLHEPLKYPGRTMYSLDEYYDSTHFYYLKPEILPGYEQVAKKKALGAIENDPLWYTSILLKRVWMFFSHTSPLQLRIGRRVIPFPFNGLIVIPALIFFARRRNWFYVKIMLFTFPLAASTILMFYSKNNTYTSAYHFIVAAILIYEVVFWVIKELPTDKQTTP